ncbi:MAG TPA: hypothetical protein DCY20_05585 [Firmicutes bacterium]|nr:hypothetical protein [Bacillota bacterium]
MSILKRFKHIVVGDYDEFLECENPLLINEVIKQLNYEFASIMMELTLAMNALDAAKSKVEQGEEMISQHFKEAMTHLHMGQNEEARVFLNKKAILLEKQTMLKEECNQAELHVQKLKELQKELEKEISSLIARRERVSNPVDKQKSSAGMTNTVNPTLSNI